VTFRSGRKLVASSPIGPLVSEISRQWAECVDKILRGQKPAQVPVQQPTKFAVGHQPQDRQGARADDPAVAAGRADEVIQ
jgi:putative ABC transport system substrate-binding protein